VPSSQQQPAGSRLQHSSSTAGAGAFAASQHAASALRRATTISEQGAADLAPLQRRASSPPAVAAPGLDLAMYRASGRLLPLNLNYMPKGLTK
jgi:hypothetical protein